ncbi:hypothetical protein Ancab_004219, partial [Ancistrocladus abbreviatus]
HHKDGLLEKCEHCRQVMSERQVLSVVKSDSECVFVKRGVHAESELMEGFYGVLLLL